MNRITDEMREKIYEMWTSGYSKHAIAEEIGVTETTMRTELWKGFTGDLYVGGREVYDPKRASLASGKSGRARIRTGHMLPPTVLEKKHDK